MRPLYADKKVSYAEAPASPKPRPQISNPERQPRSKGYVTHNTRYMANQQSNPINHTYIWNRTFLSNATLNMVSPPRKALIIEHLSSSRVLPVSLETQIIDEDLVKPVRQTLEQKGFKLHPGEVLALHEVCRGVETSTTMPSNMQTGVAFQSIVTAAAAAPPLAASSNTWTDGRKKMIQILKQPLKEIKSRCQGLQWQEVYAREKCSLVYANACAS